MNQTEPVPIHKQVWHFMVHLRWHYQLFILSGGFLMGGFFQPSMEWAPFLFQFLNVHLLLFGGATAYNSYWDKDEGAVGGLRNPPKMHQWMWFASILLQAMGLLAAIPAGELFTGIYALSMFLFWIYSSPLIRWKGTPVKSLIAIGISTGTNSFLLGYLAAGSEPIGWPEFTASIGVASVILSLYPTSQIYQLREDQRRGDRTFALKFGIKGVFIFFLIAFGLGILLLSGALGVDHLWIGTGFLVAGSATGYWIWKLLNSLSVQAEDYDKVMKIKYGTSLAFVVLLISGLIFKHIM